MTVARIALAGLVAAILSAIVWTGAALFLPLAVPYLIDRLRGEGGIGSSYVSGDSTLLAALLGFLLGAAWEWRRLRRRRV